MVGMVVMVVLARQPQKQHEFDNPAAATTNLVDRRQAVATPGFEEVGQFQQETLSNG